LKAATSPVKTTPVGGKQPDLKSLREKLQSEQSPQSLFEGEGVDDLLYSAKDVEKFKSQQEAAAKRARKSETVTSFDVQRAQEKYQKSGKEVDRIRAEALEKEWTDQGGDIRTGASAPKGVSQMIVSEGPVTPDDLSGSVVGTQSDTFKQLKRTENDLPTEEVYARLTHEKLTELKERFKNMKDVDGLIKEQINLIDKWIKIDKQSRGIE
jgi:hypothetical protein